MGTGFTKDETGLWIEKSPGGDLSYTFDFDNHADPWLAAGETLTGASFTVPDELTKVSESNTTTTATVRLSGGVLNRNYEIALAWTTTAGADARVFQVRIRNRPA